MAPTHPSRSAARTRIARRGSASEALHSPRDAPRGRPVGGSSARGARASTSSARRPTRAATTPRCGERLAARGHIPARRGPPRSAAFSAWCHASQGPRLRLRRPPAPPLPRVPRRHAAHEPAAARRPRVVRGLGRRGRRAGRGPGGGALRAPRRLRDAALYVAASARVCCAGRRGGADDPRDASLEGVSRALPPFGPYAGEAEAVFDADLRARGEVALAADVFDPLVQLYELRLRGRHGARLGPDAGRARVSDGRSRRRRSYPPRRRRSRSAYGPRAARTRWRSPSSPRAARARRSGRPGRRRRARRAAGSHGR